MAFGNYNFSIFRIPLLFLHYLLLVNAQDAVANSSVVSAFKGGALVINTPFYYQGLLRDNGRNFVPGVNCGALKDTYGDYREVEENSTVTYYSTLSWVFGCLGEDPSCCPTSWIRNAYYGLEPVTFTRQTSEEYSYLCPDGYLPMSDYSEGTNLVTLVTKSETIWPCCPILLDVFGDDGSGSNVPIRENPHSMFIGTVGYDKRTLPGCAYPTTVSYTTSITRTYVDSSVDRHVRISYHVFAANPIYVSLLKPGLPATATTSTQDGPLRTSARPGPSITNAVASTGTADPSPTDRNDSNGQTGPQPEGVDSSSKISTSMLAGIASGASILLISITIGGVYWFRRRRSMPIGDDKFGGTDDAVQPGIMEDTAIFGGICDSNVSLKSIPSRP
ncbi:hypothetical protein TWF730_004514 [Orbilia blumenaviensis]|uniref:Uncharacterized protein n=1 Tax=Orbilia blumenaviensis TaxID=1796055 RepID=A0AAV9TZ89_9PEZI